MLSGKDHTSLAVVAHVLGQALRRKWDKLLDAHRNDIAMSIYLADGWSAFCRTTETATIGTHVVYRSGKLKHEFLLQRRILKVMLDNDEVIRTMLVHEPVGLRNGRSCWHIFQNFVKVAHRRYDNTATKGLA